MADVEFASVSPVIPVRDLDTGLDRYRRLGFDTRAYPGPERYGYADRGSVSLYFTEKGYPDHGSGSDLRQG